MTIRFSMEPSNLFFSLVQRCEESVVGQVVSGIFARALGNPSSKLVISSQDDSECIQVELTDDWLVLSWEFQRRVVFSEGKDYIPRDLLPSFPQHECVKMRILGKSLLVDPQLAKDLPRQNLHQFTLNGRVLGRDVESLLERVLCIAPHLVEKVSALFNQRIGIDLNRRAFVYCHEEGVLNGAMLCPTPGTFRLDMRLSAHKVLLVGESFFHLIQLSEDGMIEEEGEGVPLKIKAVGHYDLNTGSVRYELSQRREDAPCVEVV